MKRFGIALLYGVGGYVLVAIASYFLTLQFSTNLHDRELEAGMTGAFFFGPIGGVLACIVGFVRGGRRT